MFKKYKMEKKVIIGSISITSVIFLITVSITPSFFITGVNFKINVGETETDKDWDITVPDDFDNIQDAIKNAKSGDKIFVRRGKYYSGNSFFSTSIKINRDNITIHGEDKNSTIINGRGSRIVVYIDGDNVNFSGFTIINNGVNGSLMKICSDYNIISNNIFSIKDYYDGTEYGIKLLNSDENKISNNQVFGGEEGILIVCSENNLILENKVFKNNNGIHLSRQILINFNEDFSTDFTYKKCVGNIIKNNSAYNNFRGIYISSSDDNIVDGNKISSNHNNGLVISFSTNINVKNNFFEKDGVEIYGTELSNYIHEMKDNLVNNKPLYYYYQKQRFTIPSDAGQIILIDCYEVEINNVFISDTSTGLLIAFSSNVKVKNCEFNSNNMGVYLYQSSGNSINKNNFIDNFVDAYFIVNGFFNVRRNNWNWNYWDDWIGENIRIFRLFRKRIPGRFYIQRPMIIIQNNFIGLRTRSVDRFPQRNPYNMFN
jgi:parallel beta-helix repeat protein